MRTRRRAPLTNAQITDRILAGALLATAVAVIAGVERAEPGFWFLAIDVAGALTERLIDAFRWVAAFAAVGYGGWWLRGLSARRELEQDLAQKTAHDQEQPRLLQIGDN